MKRPLLFTAVCQFPGKSSFRFHSPAFSVLSWADLERTAADTVADAWSQIAQGAPPAIIEYLPGGLALI